MTTSDWLQYWENPKSIKVLKEKQDPDQITKQIKLHHIQKKKEIKKIEGNEEKSDRAIHSTSTLPQG